jgi:hypothetical protein
VACGIGAKNDRGAAKRITAQGLSKVAQGIGRI